jgi:predicted Holliday junction resolvase-like endonuclease
MSQGSRRMSAISSSQISELRWKLITINHSSPRAYKRSVTYGLKINPSTIRQKIREKIRQKIREKIRQKIREKIRQQSVKKSVNNPVEHG